MQPLPTLRQLQFFLALVQRQSFSRAAEDCLVSQSTLSSAIKELEVLLQCQLVDRSTRTFGLTPIGEDVASRASQIVAAAEDLMRSAADRQLLEGPFHLGLIPTIAPFVLPKATPRIKKAFPKLELYLREDLTENLLDRLSTGELDAVVLALPFDSAGVEIIEIGNDPFWFVASPAHPLAGLKSVTLKDLRKSELLLLEDGHCLRDHAVEACSLRKETAAAFGATSLLTLAEMVRSGLGATLIPDMAIKAGLHKASGLKAVPLGSPIPNRKIGLVWRRGSGRGEEAAALAEILKRQLLQ